MAIPKKPDRLNPHCSWPMPPDKWNPDDIWLDYGGVPPPDYSPPVGNPLHQPPQSPLTVRQVGIRILLVLAAIIAGICLWQR